MRFSSRRFIATNQYYFIRQWWEANYDNNGAVKNAPHPTKRVIVDLLQQTNIILFDSKVFICTAVIELDLRLRWIVKHKT